MFWIIEVFTHGKKSGKVCKGRTKKMGNKKEKIKDNKLENSQLFINIID